MVTRPRPRIRAAIVIVLIAASAVALLVNFISQTPVGQGPLSFVVSPVQQVLNDIGRTFSNFFRSTGNLQTLQQRAESLRRRVTDLEAENLRLREFQAEAQQLRDLLKFANDNPTYSVVGADVIGIGDSAACDDRPPASPNAGKCANVIASDPSPFVRYVTINAGARDGIRIGMPVVAGGLALVGRVGEVSEATSQVQLLNDPGSFVNVRLVESRATGTVNGTSEGALILQNVPQTEPLKPGDLIVTSGLGGGLPQSLAVGTVLDIISSDVETSQKATVRPGVDFDRLEAVLVITSTDNNRQ
jgi:rod shape-determining protein MreC